MNRRGQRTNGNALQRVANPVDQYAIDVVEGRELAGKYHRLACERHLRDRRREGTKAFPYVFDLARAERYFRFASQLQHYKGEWAGRFIRLERHQQFRRGSLFGWVHRETGLRRIRTSYEELPRKNGKTLDLAVTSVYATFFDGEPGAEGYDVATMRKQAMIAFGDAKKLVRSCPSLRARIAIQAKNLHREATASKLEPLGADPVDGLNPHFIGVDELHKWKTRERLDVMETARGARRQPLLMQITTAGDDPVSVCGDQHDYAVKILEQVIDDETFFAFIAHADPEDDWLSEDTWQKANPNWRVSVKPEYLREMAHKARHMPAAANAFKRDHLNLWVNAEAPWLSIEGFRQGQSSWSIEELRGEPCWAAIDLSSKIDLAALALAFPPTATRKKWRYLVRHFTPADTLVERGRRDRAPYTLWTQRLIPGSPAWPYLATTPGNRLDQDVIRAAVNDAKAFGFLIQQIGFDPWNAGTIEQDLQGDGYDVVEIPQSLKSLSPPSKEFEADVLDGLVDAGGDPILLWEASNVVVFRDGPDNIKPVKKKSRGKIDGIVACIMARKLAALEDDEEASVYESRGLASV
jgi:phage terminase large subunit-like protein